MAKITVNKLSTSNTTPILTGTVDFERFDSKGNPKESIEVYVNYVPYRLFEGNLGIDETKNPKQWKLHFDSPLYPGTYEVEAIVYDISTNRIIASDDSSQELIIIAPPRPSVGQQAYNMRQRYSRLNLLMNSLNLLFGGQNGISPVPSVHPVLDDQSSTSLIASGNEEREEETAVKSRKKTVDSAPLPPKVVRFDSVDPNKGQGPNGMDWELASLDQARDDVGAVNSLQNAPDEAAALIANNPGDTNVTPSSPFG
jgi:hypothetical protein